MGSLPERWKLCWIIGASTGIGRALAERLAVGGCKVIISARSADTLAEVAARHAATVPLPLDVTSQADVAAAVKTVVAEHGVPDLVVVNAGLWQPMGADDFDADKCVQSMRVNYFGPAYVAEAIVPHLKTKPGSHFAITASVAGYRGLPKAAAYGPSKAAAITMAEVLHADLARHGVSVSVINPGFVDTPMTRVNDFPMPFIISAEKAAEHIVSGLARRKFEIAFPWPLVTMLKLARLMPYWLFFWYVRTFVQRS